MRGIQIKSLLESIDRTLLTDKKPVEKAVFLIEFLNSKKIEVDKSVASATDIKTVSKYSNTYFIDQLELQNEIDWAIKMVDYFLKLGCSDFAVIPNDQFSEKEKVALERVFQTLISLIES